MLLHHDDKLTPNMMSEHDNDGEFASVVWDTPDAANKSANAGGHGDNGGEHLPSSSTGGTTGAGAGADHQDYTQSTSSSSSHMMHRAGSTASHHTTTTGASAGHAGAAAAAGDASGSGRYWIKASVVEPVKMLEGTKDAYVAYNVKGEVGPERFYPSPATLHTTINHR